MNLNELGFLQICWVSVNSKCFTHYCWAFPAIAFNTVYGVAMHLEICNDFPGNQ